MKNYLATLIGLLLALLPMRNSLAEPDGETLFLKTILPALEDNCYECHSAKADEVKGNLRLDRRADMLRGGDNGPAVVPGDPQRSFLIRAIQYVDDDYKMPPKAKLPDELIQDFTTWIEKGAPDPREKPKPAPPPAAESKAPELDGRAGRDLSLPLFRPRSNVKTAQHSIQHARFPVVDVHTHFRVRTKHSAEELDQYVKVMDRNQVAVCVSLDGALGESFADHRDYLWTRYQDRFVIFATIDFQGTGKADDPATWDCQRPDFSRRIADQLTAAKALGLSGIKLFKQFGLVYRNADGTVLRIDDPRWDPIWERCGQLGLPVLMHTADPSAFFQPIDEHNERWEELHRHPEWSFYGDAFPKRDALIEAHNVVIARHPRTTFIAAHMANDAEDLRQVGEWMDKYPNMVTELASRISELGRQPYTAREFVTNYADRILFGTDGPWPEPRLRLYWRFLETRDEYFPYSEKDFPPQGFWNIYGVDLPDDVLHKIYHENAARIIPGVKERLDRFGQGAVKSP